MEKLNLKNLYTYSDFVKEGKNEYTIYIDGKEYSEPGDYKTGNATFKEATKIAKPGSKVEMYKTKDNRGKEVRELKKEKEVKTGKPSVPKKPISEEKEIKSAIRDHVLELFVPSPRSVDYGTPKVGEPFEISFKVSPKDFKFIAPSIDLDEVLKDYTTGVSIKKPYQVKVLDITDEFGTKLTQDNLDELKEKGAETESETKTLARLSLIDDILKREGEKPGVYKVIMTLLVEENPLYGKSKDELEKEDEDLDDIRDDWYKSEDDEDYDEKGIEDFNLDELDDL